MNYLTDVEIGIKSYLEKANQPYEFDKEKEKFMFSMDVNSKIKKLDYYIFLTDEGYCIVADFDLKITEETSEALAMYLHRINYYSYYGSFVLNLNKNQVLMIMHIKKWQVLLLVMAGISHFYVV